MLCGCHCHIWWLNDTTKWGDEELCSKATTRESWKWQTDLNHRKTPPSLQESGNKLIPTIYPVNPLISHYIIHITQTSRWPISYDCKRQGLRANSRKLTWWSKAVKHQHVEYLLYKCRCTCKLYKIIILYHIYSRYLMSLGSCSSSTTKAMTFRGPRPPVGLTGTGTCAAASLGVVFINS